jgi:hypothetical protein
MAKKSINISFMTPEQAASSATEDGATPAVILELDDEKNEDATTFAIGTKAYLRFLSSSDAAYEITASTGTAKTEDTNIHYPIEDNQITFTNSDYGYLNYIPVGSVEYEWVGNNPGYNPIFEGRKVTLGESAVAILNCNYSVAGDRLSIKSDVVGDVVVVVIQGSDQVDLTVSFREPGVDDEGDPEPDPVAYELEVIDYCTGEVLPGVTVYLDEVDMGQTDSSGIIALGSLIPGSSHDLRMAKSGYMNSESDKLNNDSILVPSE